MPNNIDAPVYENPIVIFTLDSNGEICILKIINEDKVNSYELRILVDLMSELIWDGMYLYKVEFVYCLESLIHGMDTFSQEYLEIKTQEILWQYTP